MGMDASDAVILGIAGFVAVSVLVKLMLRRHNELTQKFRAEMQRERQRQQALQQQQLGAEGQRASDVADEPR